MNLNGVEYYYVRNGQGDIISLIDKTGTEVTSYTYDSWGKLISIGGTLKDTVGVKNPYRYRGYRYDTETGLYYLQSRYYNPVMNIDSDGQWFWIVVGAVSGGYIGYKIGNKLRLYGWKLAVVTAIGAGIGAALGFTTDCLVTIFQL